MAAISLRKSGVKLQVDVGEFLETEVGHFFFLSIQIWGYRFQNQNDRLLYLRTVRWLFASVNISVVGYTTHVFVFCFIMVCYGSISFRKVVVFHAFWDKYLCKIVLKKLHHYLMVSA